MQHASLRLAVPDLAFWAIGLGRLVVIAIGQGEGAAQGNGEQQLGGENGKTDVHAMILRSGFVVLNSEHRRGRFYSMAGLRGVLVSIASRLAPTRSLCWSQIAPWERACSR
ncbi:hypothetical protein D3C73_1284840 [compost metagenome]